MAHLEAFDERGFLHRLSTEIEDAEGPEARDEYVRATLAALDVFASRVMRIRLDHLLAGDTSVEPKFRAYLASQVLDYQDDLGRLRSRVEQVAVRSDPAGAARTAAAITEAADSVLALRSRLRQGVLAFVQIDEPADDPVDDAPEPHRFELIELD